ncbi:NAD(P)/FAD-dependent oxidoreductase [Aquirufa lenticrescens]|uniref:NAD(P)/FAD-dependent oxidoreductase n=1 Tax=Aquirufa lenticrescens TaxID=2696560 RepID=UPI001CAA4767|nr:FAD/NAD(P)-binding oxidoreductase [Aquirufa lenticrescens]UAJ13140.1 NAD(P)/FAD-dependent oxidoreductase [Aquirufa lenticrescens]
MKTQHQIVIVGGGNAGISIAAQLLRKDSSLDITIVDGAKKHYYQPAWTLVGGGEFDIQDTERDEASVIPSGATWIQQMVAGFKPEENKITLADGTDLGYDYLIAAPGIQLNWGEIKGLKENLGKNGVCSNYSFATAPYTWECIQKTKGGKAIFTNPHTPIKCGGAPQKIMYLAADYFKKQGIDSQVEFWSGGTRVFGVEKYENTLKKVIARYGINTQFFVKLDEIDGPNKKAKFVGIGESNKDQEYWVEYDMIHVTPPQSAPDFIKTSPLANAAGWLDVEKHTLQHIKFNNIFGCGDAANLPASRTGAAIRKQAPVLVSNLLAVMKGKSMTASYDGYSSCPIITGYDKLVLAEFDYNNKPVETFPFDQSKERWSMYQMKKYLLPYLYWNQILPGKM